MAQRTADPTTSALRAAARQHEEVARLLRARGEELDLLAQRCRQAQEHYAHLALSLREDAAAWALRDAWAARLPPATAGLPRASWLPGRTWKARTLDAMRAAPERDWTVREIVTALGVPRADDPQGRWLEVVRKTLKRLVAEGRVERPTRRRYRLAAPAAAPQAGVASAGSA